MGFDSQTSEDRWRGQVEDLEAEVRRLGKKVRKVQRKNERLREVLAEAIARTDREEKNDGA